MSAFMVGAGALVAMSVPLLLIRRRFPGLTPIAIGLLVVAGLSIAFDLVFNGLLAAWWAD